MSNGTTPRDDAELESFLRRQSPLSTAYDALEPVQPPEVLDGKILAMAKGAAGKPAPAAKPAPKPEGAPPAAAGTGKPSSPRPAAAPGPSVAAKEPVARPPGGGTDDEDDELPVVRRPRWLVPAALAASMLVAVGVGVALLGTGPSGPGADRGTDAGATGALGSLFAKRARERNAADKAAAEAAAAAASQEAEAERAPLPPPPFFEPEGPQVQDLDTAIAMIRKELVLASQLAAIAEEAKAGEQERQASSRQAPAPAGSAGLVADTAAPSAPTGAAAAEAAGAAGVIQPRDRRLAKILELYDGGNPDLAAASLEIFLRDFEDDPISQRIIEAQPKDTDVAVE